MNHKGAYITYGGIEDLRCFYHSNVLKYGIEKVLQVFKTFQDII